MQSTEIVKERFSELSLPAAHLVIDMRGVDNGRALDWLRVEIADLANEMQSTQVQRWRYLQNFLSFKQIDPLTQHAAPASTLDDELAELSAEYTPSTQKLNREINVSAATDASSRALFLQKTTELIREIDRIRTNRIVAMQDITNEKHLERSSRETVVRVIFLVDFALPASLTSAALYAEHLKHYYRKLERPGQLPLLNTLVLCLGVATPSVYKELCRNNRWDHLDTLILSENPQADATLSDSHSQEYLAESLLFVLVMLPLLPVSPLISAKSPVEAQREQETALPLHTYTINLAVLEYSARWGKRWLNFSLAHTFVDLLRQKLSHPEMERLRLTDLATNWFQNWRRQIQEAIPDGLPGEVAALSGVYRAQQMVHQVKVDFSLRSFFALFKQNASIKLEKYLHLLAETYVTVGDEPVLQDALLLGSSQIMLALREKEGVSSEQQRQSDLGNLYVEARQLLGRPPFLSNANQALAGAALQLSVLGDIFSTFREEHQQNSLNPLAMRETVEGRKHDLQEKGQRLIGHLKKLSTRWPFLSAIPFLQPILQGCVFFLLFLVTFLSIFLGAAWMHHILLTINSGLLLGADSLVLNIPLLDLLAFLLFLISIPLEIFTLRPHLLHRRTSGPALEVAFFLLLLSLSVTDLLLNFSIARFTNEAGSFFYVAWLAALPVWTRFALPLGLLLLVSEGIFFIFWVIQLYREPMRIVRRISNLYHQDILDILTFVADDVALAIAQRFELCDAKGSTGLYFSRISQLTSLLDTIADATQLQEQIAADRLLFKQSTQADALDYQDADVLLNVHRRDERLELDRLTDGQKTLCARVVHEVAILREMAAFLIRSEGVETPGEIEQDLREQGRLSQEESRLRLFMTSLVAIALRCAIDPLPLSTSTFDLAYKDDDYIKDYIQQNAPAVNSLIQTLNKRVSQATLQVSSDTHGQGYSQPHGTNVAVDALALWGQIFWQQRSEEHFAQLLKPSGLVEHLTRQLKEAYDPTTILRRLLMCTAFFGRSWREDQVTNLYLLMSQAHKIHFSKGLKSSVSRRILSIPDQDRILLLGIRRFIGETPTLLEARPGEAEALSIPTSSRQLEALDTPGASLASEPIMLRQRGALRYVPVSKLDMRGEHVYEDE